MRISSERLKQLKTYFAPGTRVRLIKMEDDYSKLKPGDLGTVIGVDDIGTVHVSWDIGSSLGVVLGVDICEKIED